MATDRDEYVASVIRHVEQELEALNKTLPTALKVDSVQGAQSDWKLGISVDAGEEREKWFDFFEVLSILARKVNERFKEDKWYFGIELLVPDRLLGKFGIEKFKQRLQQERDNDEFRQVRLRKNNG